jgi:hypothetical protein
VSLVRDGRGLRQLPPDTTTPPASLPAAAPSSTRSTTTAAQPQEVVIAAGDNLWEVAARQLAMLTGRSRADIADADIARYWIEVCEANRAQLRSGDPNLIFPGERVVLPPIS